MNTNTNTTERKAFAIGEIINKNDIIRLYTTANACAKAATEIHRDSFKKTLTTAEIENALQRNKKAAQIAAQAEKTESAREHAKAAKRIANCYCSPANSNANKYVYLDKQAQAHNVIYYHINQYGVDLYSQSGSMPEYMEAALDSLQDAALVIASHNGEQYTDTIRKEARNAAGRYLHKRERKADTLNAVSIESEKEVHGDYIENHVVNETETETESGTPLFMETESEFDYNMESALSSLDKIDKYILIASAIYGQTQEEIAKQINRSQSFVAKHFTKAKKAMEKSLVSSVLLPSDLNLLSF